MTRRRLLWRSLRFHWRGNLAVLLGVAVGTAVLTGALLVGDSLRGSLVDLTERRLGWVDQALIGGRFFRAEAARDLPAERVAPALLLQGAASDERTGQRRGGVVILGVDDRFWPAEAPPVESVLWRPEAARLWGDGVVLNETLARELQAQPGDEIVLNLQKTSEVPRETLLGRRDSSAVLTTVRLKVAAIAPNDSLAGSFSLNPSPQPPRNAFVPLWLLQDRLDLEGRVNALLVAGPGDNLADAFRQRLTLDDWGLLLRDPRSRTQALFTQLDRSKDDRLQASEYRDQLGEEVVKQMDRDEDRDLTRAEVVAHYRQQHGYLSLESKQMLLEPAVAEAALAAAKELGLTAAPTLVYLANTIQEGEQSIPYSVVAALDPALPPPLGPLLPPGVERLQDDEIILADWKASPLAGKVGDEIRLKYFAPEEQGGLKEMEARFRLRGLLPLAGAALDPDLTPEFPGITDKLTLDKWDPPFPYDNKRVGKRDEDYWKQYRTTPKAYVTLAAGQKLWGSRFGELTSIRLVPPSSSEGNPPDLRRTAEEFQEKLQEKLRPERLGLVFDPVRGNALAASEGGMDFGLLFLGFSFFLIAAALLLVGLLVRLNIDRRAEEIGLLLAAGYRVRAVRRLLLTEGSLLAALGGLLGLAGAVGYAWLLLDYLATRWPGALDQSFLRLHVTVTSLLTGYAAAVAVSVLTISWAVRVLGRAAPSALLAGQTAGGEREFGRGRPRWSYRLAIGSLVLGIALIVFGAFGHDHETRAMTFFGGGALLLTAGLTGAWIWMRHSARAANQQSLADNAWPLTGLGVRNAARQPMRSLLTAGLLASAAFLLVVVEAFRRQPETDYLNKTSGSGGFALLVESELPIYQDLNTEAGREEAGFPDRMQPAFQDVQFVALRRRGGDDASCLNLYQPRRPQLFGVPPSLIDRGGFRFAGSEAETAEERDNPWLLLRKPAPDGAIPVFGEKNTVQWMLKAGLGSEFEITDERGQPVKLRIVGLLQDSVFQNGLLLAEDAFQRLHPHQEGYTVLLVAPPPERTEAVAGLLREALARRGVEVTPAAERLALYLQVENTYLSTFQALGGLGLLLGALGLAVVLLRSVWERRGELALLRALGFRHSALGRLVLAENAFLMILGLLAGIAAALLAVSPSIAVGEAHVPWLNLASLLVLVLAVGLGTGAAALAATLRAPLLPALRRE